MYEANKYMLHVWSWEMCIVYKIRGSDMFEANKYLLNVWSWEMCVVYKIRGIDMDGVDKYMQCTKAGTVHGVA